MTVRAIILAAVLALGSVPAKEPDPLDGRYIAARYTLGVMRRVSIKRGIPFGDCGMSFDGPPLGSLVRVEGVRTGHVRECIVIDVSQTIDLKRHLKARQIELDDASAKDICSLKYYKSRPRECPVIVVVLRRGK